MQESISDKLNEIFKTTQSKSYFIAFITFIFILILVLFGILPAYSAFIFQSNENSRRDDLIVKLDKKLNISKSLTSEYTNKGSIISYFNQIFPSEAFQDNITQIITSYVNNNGDTLQTISFNRDGLQDINDISTGNLSLKVKRQLVTILVQGSQSSLLKLVNDFESSRRILNIKGIVLARKTDQEILNSKITGDYKLTAQIIYYYYDKNSSTP